MAECQVCFASAEEVAEIGAVTPRHMLPCHCKLLLCDVCVMRIKRCLYHRASTPDHRASTPDDAADGGDPLQRLAVENTLLRTYLKLVTLMSAFMVLFNAAAFLMGGVQCGTFISFFLGITAFVMMQVVELGSSPLLQVIALAWWACVSVVVFVWSWCLPP
jgi:hypothetical protein